MQLGIVNRDQADVMLRFTPLTRPSTLEHRAARSQGVSEVVKLLKGLQSLQGKVPDDTARRNRWASCLALKGVCGSASRPAEPAAAGNPGSPPALRLLAHRAHGLVYGAVLL